MIKSEVAELLIYKRNSQNYGLL